MDSSQISVLCARLNYIISNKEFEDFDTAVEILWILYRVAPDIFAFQHFGRLIQRILTYRVLLREVNMNFSDMNEGMPRSALADEIVGLFKIPEDVQLAEENRMWLAKTFQTALQDLISLATDESWDRVMCKDEIVLNCDIAWENIKISTNDYIRKIDEKFCQSKLSTTSPVEDDHSDSEQVNEDIVLNLYPMFFMKAKDCFHDEHSEDSNDEISGERGDDDLTDDLISNDVDQGDGPISSDVGQRDDSIPSDGDQRDDTIPNDGDQRDGTIPNDGDQRDGTIPSVCEKSGHLTPSDADQRDGIIIKDCSIPKDDDQRDPSVGEKRDQRNPNDGGKTDCPIPSDGDQRDDLVPNDGDLTVGAKQSKDDRTYIFHEEEVDVTVVPESPRSTYEDSALSENDDSPLLFSSEDDTGVENVNEFEKDVDTTQKINGSATDSTGSAFVHCCDGGDDIHGFIRQIAAALRRATKVNTGNSMSTRTVVEEEISKSVPSTKVQSDRLCTESTENPMSDDAIKYSNGVNETSFEKDTKNDLQNAQDHSDDLQTKCSENSEFFETINNSNNSNVQINDSYLSLMIDIANSLLNAEEDDDDDCNYHGEELIAENMISLTDEASEVWEESDEISIDDDVFKWMTDNHDLDSQEEEDTAEPLLTNRKSSEKTVNDLIEVNREAITSRLPSTHRSSDGRPEGNTCNSVHIPFNRSDSECEVDKIFEERPKDNKVVDVFGKKEVTQSTPGSKHDSDATKGIDISTEMQNDRRKAGLINEEIVKNAACTNGRLKILPNDCGDSRMRIDKKQKRVVRLINALQKFRNRSNLSNRTSTTDLVNTEGINYTNQVDVNLGKQRNQKHSVKNKETFGTLSPSGETLCNHSGNVHPNNNQLECALKTRVRQRSSENSVTNQENFENSPVSCLEGRSKDGMVNKTSSNRRETKQPVKARNSAFHQSNIKTITVRNEPQNIRSQTFFRNISDIHCYGVSSGTKFHVKRKRKWPVSLSHRISKKQKTSLRDQHNSTLTDMQKTNEQTNRGLLINSNRISEPISTTRQDKRSGQEFPNSKSSVGILPQKKVLNHRNRSCHAESSHCPANSLNADFTAQRNKNVTQSKNIVDIHTKADSTPQYSSPSSSSEEDDSRSVRSPSIFELSGQPCTFFTREGYTSSNLEWNRWSSTEESSEESMKNFVGIVATERDTLDFIRKEPVAVGSNDFSSSCKDCVEMKRSGQASHQQSTEAAASVRNEHLSVSEGLSKNQRHKRKGRASPLYQCSPLKNPSESLGSPNTGSHGSKQSGVQSESKPDVRSPELRNRLIRRVEVPNYKVQYSEGTSSEERSAVVSRDEESSSWQPSSEELSSEELSFEEINTEDLSSEKLNTEELSSGTSVFDVDTDSDLSYTEPSAGELSDEDSSTVAQSSMDESSSGSEMSISEARSFYGLPKQKQSNTKFHNAEESNSDSSSSDDGRIVESKYYLRPHVKNSKKRKRVVRANPMRQVKCNQKKNSEQHNSLGEHVKRERSTSSSCCKRSRTIEHTENNTSEDENQDKNVVFLEAVVNLEKL